LIARSGDVTLRHSKCCAVGLEGILVLMKCSRPLISRGGLCHFFLIKVTKTQDGIKLQRSGQNALARFSVRPLRAGVFNAYFNCHCEEERRSNLVDMQSELSHNTYERCHAEALEA
jgi:hypothetical protein